MITGVDHLFDRAVDPGQHALDDRRTRARRRPRQPVEAGFLAREAPAQITLIGSEDVDAERAGAVHRRPARRSLSGQEPDERRVERDGGERADRQADGAVFTGAGDDGHSRREVTEDLTKPRAVET